MQRHRFTHARSAEPLEFDNSTGVLSDVDEAVRVDGDSFLIVSWKCMDLQEFVFARILEQRIGGVAYDEDAVCPGVVVQARQVNDPRREVSCDLRLGGGLKR